MGLSCITTISLVIFDTCKSNEDSSLGRESIRVSMSFAVLAINLANTGA